VASRKTVTTDSKTNKRKVEGGRYCWVEEGGKNSHLRKFSLRQEKIGQKLDKLVGRRPGDGPWQPVDEKRVGEGAEDVSCLKNRSL